MEDESGDDEEDMEVESDSSADHAGKYSEFKQVENLADSENDDSGN